MYRFLLSRRWLGLLLAVLVLATLCVRLGFWQLSRLHERLADNALIEHNMAEDAVPLTTLTGQAQPVDDSDEWRTVTVTGRYDTDDQLLVRYQTNGQARGADVVVPLVRADGTAVLVDRGFLESPEGTPATADVPVPASGQVTVSGWLRQDSTASSEATVASDGTVRAVSSAALADAVRHPLAAGWVQARQERPAGPARLAGPEPPELDSGPHLFYALQWWFFALLAIVGYLYFAYDEAHPGRRPARPRRPDAEDDDPRDRLTGRAGAGRTAGSAPGRAAGRDGPGAAAAAG